jgi:hypothetical protein
MFQYTAKKLISTESNELNLPLQMVLSSMRHVRLVQIRTQGHSGARGRSTGESRTAAAASRARDLRQ